MTFVYDVPLQSPPFRIGKSSPHLKDLKTQSAFDGLIFSSCISASCSRWALLKLGSWIIIGVGSVWKKHTLKANGFSSFFHVIFHFNVVWRLFPPLSDPPIWGSLLKESGVQPWSNPTLQGAGPGSCWAQDLSPGRGCLPYVGARHPEAARCAASDWSDLWISLDPRIL